MKTDHDFRDLNDVATLRITYNADAHPDRLHKGR